MGKVIRRPKLDLVEFFGLVTAAPQMTEFFARLAISVTA